MIQCGRRDYKEEGPKSMFYISEIQKKAPGSFKTPLQELVYRTLTELQIDFERVDTDEAITM